MRSCALRVHVHNQPVKKSAIYCKTDIITEFGIFYFRRRLDFDYYEYVFIHWFTRFKYFGNKELWEERKKRKEICSRIEIRRREKRRGEGLRGEERSKADRRRRHIDRDGRMKVGCRVTSKRVWEQGMGGDRGRNRGQEGADMRTNIRKQDAMLKAFQINCTENKILGRTFNSTQLAGNDCISRYLAIPRYPIYRFTRYFILF